MPLYPGVSWSFHWASGDSKDLKAPVVGCGDSKDIKIPVICCRLNPGFKWEVRLKVLHTKFKERTGIISFDRPVTKEGIQINLINFHELDLEQGVELVPQFSFGRILPEEKI